MGFLAVLIAAVATFAFGAVYYMLLSKPWLEASGVPVDVDGKPINASNPAPYLVSFVMILMVAGMMRHTFALSSIDTLGKGIVSGAGVGIFFIAPWIFINTGYANRPWKLAVIDAGYPAIGCAIMGAVLILFA